MFTIPWNPVHVPVESVFTIPWKLCSRSRGIRSLQFLITQNRTTSLWEQPLTGGETKQLIQFSAGQIFDFKWSSDGRRLLLMRGSTTTDAVLLNAIP